MYPSLSEVEFDFSKFEVYTASALNIKEIITKQIQHQKDKSIANDSLTTSESRELKKGIKYLDLALQGEKISERTCSQGIITGAIDAIDACIETHKILQLQPYLESHPESSFTKEVEKFKRVLISIKSQDERSESSISDEDLNQTFIFFDLLSKESMKIEYFNFLGV